MTRHGERGQVLPVWAMGVVAMLVLTLMVVRYADMVRWQIRAQNAADSAAQYVIALQTQQYNEMTSVLYAAAVEEYRVRRILAGLELVAYHNGGCDVDGSCETRYKALLQQYFKAATRYREEVVMLNRVTSNMNASTMATDASTLVTHLATACGTAGGGDCAFNYALVKYQPRAPVYTVQMDARAFIKPSLGQHMNEATGVNAALVPAEVEVAVCADVPSPVPAFLNFQPAKHRVIARAAATAVMMEQDWFQPGSLYNPWTQNFYQPVEHPAGTPSDDGAGTDWYDVDFGGNGSTAYKDLNGYRFGIFNDEFSAYLGWWNGVPIRPFAGAAAADSQLGCPS